jgi:stage III sporulation protein AE
MKKANIIFLVLFCVIWSKQPVAAAQQTAEMGQVTATEGEEDATDTEEIIGELLDDMDFSAIDGVLKDENISSSSFKEAVEEAIDAQNSGIVTGIIQGVGNEIADSITTDWKQVGMVMAMAVVSAVFTNFSVIFCGNHIGETGFYVVYLLLVSVLVAVFKPMAAMAQEILDGLLSFMQVLLPTFFMAMGTTGQISSATAFYSLTMLMVTVIQWVYLKVLFPLTWLYFILRLVNSITMEDALGGFADLLDTIIRWVIKCAMGTIVGLHLVQGMILPSVDQLKSTTLGKALSSFPGVSTMSTVGQLVVGAGCIVKNAIGSAALIVLAGLTLLPMAKLGLFSFAYQCCGAVIQPVTDKRILGCVQATTDSLRLLMRVLGSAAILFVIVIALTCVMTNTS